MKNTKPLKPTDLCRYCDTEQLSFETTDELQDLDTPVGQDRALNALEFGIGIQREGYNLFVLGRSGSGKFTIVENYLKKLSTTNTTPHDWVYVSNFKHNHKPHALELPTGKGITLSKDMDHFVEDLHSAIPAAFETEEYHVRIHEIETEFEEKREDAFEALTKEAEEHNIRLLRTPSGFAFAPIADNDVINPKDYNKLPEEQRKQIEAQISLLEEKLTGIIRQIPIWQRDARNKVKALDREIAKFAVENLADELKKTYADHSSVLDYLNTVQQDVIDNVSRFRRPDERATLLGQSGDNDAFKNQYKVNVVVDHSSTQGVPVIYENNPAFQNLFGRVEHISQLGTLLTDFTLIKPGALHRANGGYLILDARKLLVQPFAWEGLKRALQSHEIRTQSPAELYSLISTISLEPQPIPLSIKIVLLGDRMLYYLLSAYDPEFGELFKVAADFEDSVFRNQENDLLYARLIATLARQEQLLAFDKSAVARILERAARLVDDAEKLTTHMLSVLDLMREADYVARSQQRDTITRPDVETAIDAQINRANRIQNNMYEQIERGTYLIDTSGAKVAQVNGLSVIELGQYSFGQPSRITATARLGEGEVIDIEREVELGGSIHSKGVLILSSFLAARYAKNNPLPLSASLVFEQNYGMVEGDSASLAELCALISALIDVPIKQNLAITGSVNQLGEAQPIGGVNEKIEGFFAICKTRQLTGDQGVIIPNTNVKHLMLNKDVVNAVSQQQFYVYAIDGIDEAIELLTGLPAGAANEDGDYPEGSINYRVCQRLNELTDLFQEFNKAAESTTHKTDHSHE